jgi:hypothetical protein
LTLDGSQRIIILFSWVACKFLLMLSIFFFCGGWKYRKGPSGKGYFFFLFLSFPKLWLQKTFAIFFHFFRLFFSNLLFRKQKFPKFSKPTVWKFTEKKHCFWHSITPKGTLPSVLWSNSALTIGRSGHNN